MQKTGRENPFPHPLKILSKRQPCQFWFPFFLPYLTGSPQFKQNASPSSISAPHFIQIFFCTSSFVWHTLLLVLSFLIYLYDARVKRSKPTWAWFLSSPFRSSVYLNWMSTLPQFDRCYPDIPAFSLLMIVL